MDYKLPDKRLKLPSKSLRMCQNISETVRMQWCSPGSDYFFPYVNNHVSSSKSLQEFKNKKDYLVSKILAAVVHYCSD